MMGNKGVVYAVYEKIGDKYVFSDFVNEAVAKTKQRFSEIYKVIRLDLPRTLTKKANLELVVNDEKAPREGRGERPTSPRPNPNNLERHLYSTPDLTNLRLDVQEGVV